MRGIIVVTVRLIISHKRHHRCVICYSQNVVLLVVNMQTCRSASKLVSVSVAFRESVMLTVCCDRNSVFIFLKPQRNLVWEKKENKTLFKFNCRLGTPSFGMVLVSTTWWTLGFGSCRKESYHAMIVGRCTRCCQAWQLKSPCYREFFCQIRERLSAVLGKVGMSTDLWSGNWTE